MLLGQHNDPGGRSPDDRLLELAPHPVELRLANLQVDLGVLDLVLLPALGALQIGLRLLDLGLPVELLRLPACVGQFQILGLTLEAELLRLQPGFGKLDLAKRHQTFPFRRPRCQTLLALEPLPAQREVLGVLRLPALLVGDLRPLLRLVLLQLEPGSLQADARLLDLGREVAFPVLEIIECLAVARLLLPDAAQHAGGVQLCDDVPFLHLDSIRDDPHHLAPDLGGHLLRVHRLELPHRRHHDLELALICLGGRHGQPLRRFLGGCASDYRRPHQPGPERYPPGDGDDRRHAGRKGPHRSHCPPPAAAAITSSAGGR